MPSRCCSNEAFHSVYPRLEPKLKKVTHKKQEVAELEARLAVARIELEAAEIDLKESGLQQELKELEPRLSFSPVPDPHLLSILGQLGKKAGKRAACVKREWRDVVGTARGLGMKCSWTELLSVAVGGGSDGGFTVVCLSAGVFSCGGGMHMAFLDSEDEDGQMPELGHGGEGTELVPRMVEALVGKEVIGAAAGMAHTAVWTDAGELFTFGMGRNGRLGHGGTQDEFVPRLVEALVGKKVIGAAAGDKHTAVWTEKGVLFTFGTGENGALGHGGNQSELVPRLVEALVGKKVIGAVAGGGTTAVWTEAGELFTFGYGGNGMLGHGGEESEHVPRLVEALVGKKVVGAATSGTDNAAVWTEAGELFTFGCGRDGMLGHGGEESEHVPRLVEALVGKKVIGAAAGGDHTAVWTDVGELFTFGEGTDGMLGHGGEEHEYVPRLVEALAGKKVIGAAADLCNTAVWTEAGELFTFGDGRFGTLGHGRIQSELVPRLVDSLVEA
jgi:alpha-tubulin suppressor-like RCC1 family protein